MTITEVILCTPKSQHLRSDVTSHQVIHPLLVVKLCHLVEELSNCDTVPLNVRYYFKTM